jgi:hypothetical protein
VIIERLVWTVSPEKQEQLVEMLLPHLHDAANPIVRLYTPKIGALGTVVAELEYENLAAWEKAWAKWKSPEKAADVARGNELAHISEATIWDPVK